MPPDQIGLTLLLGATRFAASKHRDQRRKDAKASPYINHPIAVAELLARVGRVTDSAILAAALLHDTIEDTKTRYPELVEAFGTKVAELVQEVTDNKRLHKKTRKRLQVEHAPHLSKGARLVKLADKICNLRDIVSSPPADWTVARKREYFDWAKAVVNGMRPVNAALEGTALLHA
jgi:guanosine-3',5'-bis(diphosphate) 3'-pyrophosphohydrolase